MSYEVRYAPSFERELRGVLGYMEEMTGSTATQDKLLNRIREVKETLETFPEVFPYVDDGYLRLREYRKARVGRHLLLYRISEYRAIVDDGKLVDHGAVGGAEGVVRVTHLFGDSQDWEQLV